MSVEQDLQTAHEIIDYGVPIVAWPMGGYPPKGWPTAEPDHSVIDNWNGKDRLYIVTGARPDGRGIDVCDVDPRHQGVVDAQLAQVAVGRISTPSGGVHLWLPAANVRKGSPAKGIDYNAGTQENEGRGLAAIPPSQGSHTTPDVTYVWDSRPVLTSTTPTVEQSLYISSLQRTPPPRGVAGPKIELPTNARAAATAWENNYVTAKIHKLTSLPSQVEKPGLWDEMVYGVARDLVRLSNSDWTSRTTSELREAYSLGCSALAPHGEASWSDRMVDKWDRALVEVTDAVPTPAEITRLLAGEPDFDASNEADFERELIHRLGTGPLAGIFKVGGELMHYGNITSAGYVEQHQDKIFNFVTKPKLASLIDESYWVFSERVVRGGAVEREHVMAPDRAVDRALNSALPSVRRVQISTRTPLVSPQGELLDQPGYDANTKALFIPLYVGQFQSKTWKSAKEAREYLCCDASDEGLFGQIAWAGPNKGVDSRATYLALLLTPILELLCPPPWPLFAITAPDRGSGKSLLTECAQDIFSGSKRGMSKETEEFRKSVTTILANDTGKIMCFDNVEKTVANDELSRLLTDDTWSDRYLGANRDATLPNDRIWCLTGNNIQIGADQRRRTMWIMIDAEVEKPWERTDFRDHHLRETVVSSWSDILSALCHMVTSWIEAGKPMAADTAERYDSFGLWVRTINGILAHSGAEGRLGRSERESGLFESDTWATLYENIAEQYQDTPWSVRTISMDSRLASTVEEVVSDLVKSSESSKKTAFGNRLRKRENQWIGGYRVVKDGEKQRAVQWRLEKQGGWPEEELPAPAPTDAELGIDLQSLLGKGLDTPKGRE